MSSLQYLKVWVKVGDKKVPLEDLNTINAEARFREEAKQIVRRFAPLMAERAKKHLDDRLWHRARSTRKLRNSIGWRPTALGASVYAGAPYAKFVEDDTQPHVILPRRARLLHWVDYGGEHRFAKRVRHPGTMGKHMIRDAVNDYRLAMGNELRRAMARSLGGR